MRVPSSIKTELLKVYTFLQISPLFNSQNHDSNWVYFYLFKNKTHTNRHPIVNAQLHEGMLHYINHNSL